ncbi:MAG: hypothetical protein CM15mP129_10770 [Chloroflexota bacterium]|nr:MAG: hypothetical protein CM15mP129_10770 [Chloroflexota bacterium]
MVCNVATQLSETDNFNAADHFYEIQKYTQNLKIDYFIVNNKLDELGDNFPTSSVVEMGDLSNLSTNVIKNNLMNDNFKGHHDSDKLSNEIMKIIKNNVYSTINYYFTSFNISNTSSSKRRRDALFGQAESSFRVRRGFEKVLFRGTIFLSIIFVIIAVLSARF